ncbi:VOC family protein [Sphingopyxis sp.]|uniref:VOC family protein n=1 Tax=Sphingopyxis sp. TaxID=1908224 RepID=UPI002FC5EFF8
MALRLAYCGLGLSDVDAWSRFGIGALGMMADDRGDLRRLRIDDRAWRFALHPGSEDDIRYAGFECEDLAELASRRDTLVAAGIICTDLEEAERAERQIEAGFRLCDPDGLRIELVVGHEAAAAQFHSDLTQGFCTGDQGLGHIVLTIVDLDRGIQFYEKLGFALSDFITVPMGPASLRIAFMHCNARHHSLAIAALPGGKRLNHIMVEVEQVDEVLLGHRRCVEQGYTTGGIGRHPNDQMLSFYVQTPAGFDVEYGWGGREIHGEWDVAEYDHISIWGHERAA